MKYLLICEMDLSAQGKVKPYYWCGEGQWSSERSHAKPFDSKYQAEQAKAVSIFSQEIEIHEDA